MPQDLEVMYVGTLTVEIGQMDQEVGMKCGAVDGQWCVQPLFAIRRGSDPSSLSSSPSPDIPLDGLPSTPVKVWVRPGVLRQRRPQGEVLQR